MADPQLPVTSREGLDTAYDSTGHDELVVLLDEEGAAVGTMPKAVVHTDRTPLHLAFSIYAFDADGRFLLTRRALDKTTFPGVWTNAACGHPAPGEALVDAAARGLQDELGLTLTGARLVLPDFRYRAEMNGVVENELCPVFTGTVSGTVRWAADEVADTAWVDWRDFVESVLSGGREVSVWCAAQVRRLHDLGPDPRAWPDADPALLPPPPAERAVRRLYLFLRTERKV